MDINSDKPKPNRTIKSKFRKLGRQLARANKWMLAFFALLLIILATQLVSLVRSGEFFGWQILSQEPAPIGLSGLSDRIKSNTANSLVCQTLDVEYIGEKLGAEVAQSAFTEDITEPNFFSSCIYRNAERLERATDKRQVSASIQQSTDDTAQETIDKLKDRHGDDLAEKSGIGDEAYFLARIGQINVRQGNRVVMVTVNTGGDSIDEEAVATEIAQKLLQVEIK